MVSPSLVVLGIHKLDCLHKLFRILRLNPFPKQLKTELLSYHLPSLFLYCTFAQVPLKVHENTLVMLTVKNSVYHMADEKLQFQLTSDMNVLCYVLVCFCENMPDYQAITFFKLWKVLCLGVEILRLKFLNLKFGKIVQKQTSIFFQWVSQVIKFFFVFRTACFFQNFGEVAMEHFKNVILKGNLLNGLQKFLFFDFFNDFFEEKVFLYFHKFLFWFFVPWRC